MSGLGAWRMEALSLMKRLMGSFQQRHNKVSFVVFIREQFKTSLIICDVGRLMIN